MKPLISMAGLCAAIILQACDRDTVAGTNNETHTKGTFYQANGKPAVGARVRVYSAAQQETDSTTAQVAQEYVDQNGNVALKLKPGHYSLVADSGSISAFIDSVFSDGDKVAIPVDTLRPTGTITGYIRVQPMHSPSIAWVHLMRTNLYTKVDSTGFFRFANVPAGSLDLVAVSHLSEYTHTHKLVRALPDSTVHVDTIDLVYNGLPLVTGIAATYDTLSGVVTLTWHDTTYARKAGYVIYRQEGASSWASPSERGYTEPSIYHDTVFGGFGATPSRYDSAEFDLTYWVGAKATDQISRAPIWNKVSLHAKTPALAKRWKVEWTLGPITSMESYSIDFNKLDTIEQNLVLTSTSWNQSLNRRQVTLEIFDPSMNRQIMELATDTNYDEIGHSFWKSRIWRILGVRGSRFLVDSSGSWRTDADGNPSYEKRPIYDSFIIISSSDASNWDTTRLATQRDSVTDFRIRGTSTKLYVTELFDSYRSTPGSQTTIPLARYSFDGTKWTFESNPNPTIDNYSLNNMTIPLPPWKTEIAYTNAKNWTIFSGPSTPPDYKSKSCLIPGISSDTNSAKMKLPSEFALRDRGDLLVIQMESSAGIASPESPALWQTLSLPSTHTPFCFWRGKLVALGANRLHFATITPNQ